MKTDLAATPTGLEPATSAVTGRRANQLRYRALINQSLSTYLLLLASSAPNGIRTRVTAVKGQRPRPLDDGGKCLSCEKHEIEAYGKTTASGKAILAGPSKIRPVWITN